MNRPSWPKSSGSAVRVLAGNLNESILIAVGDGRIGVNYDVAQKIYVY